MAADLAASSRGSRTDFRSEIPKEMKMPTPKPDPGTTPDPFPPPGPAPTPGPVAVTNTSPKIAITNTDKRQIDNLRLSVKFMINGQPHFDYEDHGTFNQVCVDRVYAYNGKWDGSQWVGDFLHTQSSQSTGAFLQTLRQAEAQTGYDPWPPQDESILPNITIVNEEPRAITGLRVTAEFTINGQPYIDYEDIGNFDRHYILELNGMNGTWNGSKWVGNFLVTKGSGFDTTINPGLLAFLNTLVIIGMAANAAAAVAGAAIQIKHGYDGESPGQGGWQPSQVW
jgi:hypothetical protein